MRRWRRPAPRLSVAPPERTPWILTPRAELAALAVGGGSSSRPAERAGRRRPLHGGDHQGEQRLREGKARALQRCRERVIEGQLPPETECEANLETIGAIANKRQKLRSAIVKRLRRQGQDLRHPGRRRAWTRSAGTSAAVRTSRSALLRTRSRAAATSPAASSASTMQAVDEAIALEYDGFKLTDPKTQKDLNRCQVAIGKESIRFLVAESKALARCWAAVRPGEGRRPVPRPGRRQGPGGDRERGVQEDRRDLQGLRRRRRRMRHRRTTRSWRRSASPTTAASSVACPGERDARRTPSSASTAMSGSWGAAPRGARSQRSP